MKKSIFVSALLVLSSLSAVQADLEFSPFPMRTAGPTWPEVTDNGNPVVGAGTFIVPNDDVKLPDIRLEDDWILGNVNAILPNDGASSSGS